jgi:hypothetical protein
MMRKAAILLVQLWGVALWGGSVAFGAPDDGGLSLESVLASEARQPQALNWAGVHDLRQSDPDLTGAGVRLGVICRSLTYLNGNPQNDYQPNTKHTCLANAQLQYHDSRLLPAQESPHSTAVCSILFGDDPAAVTPYLDPFLYQGVVPAAEGHIYELYHFVAQYVHPQNPPKVDVATASFGQELEDWWTRGIEALIEHQGLVFVASIGNGSNSSEPPFYPGAGPNAIGVGVVSSVNAVNPVTKLSRFALAYPQESSAGPTDDGRCKPDLIAPGNCLVAAAEGAEGYAMAGNWSSFSTPVAAGVVGLLVQAAKQGEALRPALAPKGGNCVLKAILMSSAVKLPHWHKGRLTTADDHEVPLDYVQGAGMVDAVRAHRLLTAGQGQPGDVATAGWDLNQLDTQQVFQQVYRLTIDEPADKVLTATLTWNHHYREKYPFERLPDKDSDLRLEVWAVNPANPSQDLLLDYSDSRVDNVEHIHFHLAPPYTQYKIVVSYANLNAVAAATERYALAWTVEPKSQEEDILWYDLNGDGIVNEQDLRILMYNLLAERKSSQAYLIGDVNGDGTIDERDVQEMLQRQNRTADWYASNVTK